MIMSPFPIIQPLRMVLSKQFHKSSIYMINQIVKVECEDK